MAPFRTSEMAGWKVTRPAVCPPGPPCFRRYVNEPDGPAESGGQRRGHLGVRDGFRPGQGVRGTLVAGLGECDRSYRFDVPHVHRASASTMARPVFPVVRQEVKETALRQLAEAGLGGLSISAIGKQLGVSGPALYRYFASRDDLLTKLVIDAYHDLANALAVAASHVPDDNPRNRFEALARAYRRWARAEPHRYRLLFGQTSSSRSS
jgi:tetracycline repressor-like protein/WHG domain-containing protein